MIYKYFAARWGIEFLKTLRVRYTQFAALNDPYEGEVLIRDLLTSEQWAKAKQKLLDPNEFNPGLREIVADILRGKLAPIEALGICADWMRRERDHYGVLSLSRTATSLPMWAHYCAEHTGIVVGFDADHSVFHDGGPSVRPVLYTAQCPEVVFSRMTGIDMWFTKNAQWTYEEEMRHTKILPEIRQGTPHDERGHPVFLFELPRDCVTSIIAGSRASQDTISAIRELRHQFPSVVPMKAVRVLNGYAMGSHAIDPNEI